MVETLADLGVPYDEAYAYTEGVRRGGALVVVESSEERASVAWRSCNGCTPSTSTSGQPSGSRRAGPARRPTPGRRPPRRPRRPARRSGQPPGWHGRHGGGFRWCKRIAVGTREVERGHVRIASRVTEHPVEEAVRLREEKVTVERRPQTAQPQTPTLPPLRRR